MPDSLPPLRVLYVDASVLLLDKPAGLLSVPGRGADKQDCLSRRAQAHYPDALVVHRLDMATSGLLLMARGVQAQRSLNAAFRAQAIAKRYRAVVAGDCRAQSLQTLADGTQPAPWQRIDLPIHADWAQRPLRRIDATLGKPSSTRWRCVAFDAVAQASHLELEPLTGRSHQLRVHLQAIGHPILGDALYAPAALADASPYLLLHAQRMEFAHPLHGARCAFECPLPQHWPAQGLELQGA